MLFTGRQYSLGMLVNGKQGEPMVVNEMDTRGPAWHALLDRSAHGDGDDGVHAGRHALHAERTRAW